MTQHNISTEYKNRNTLVLHREGFTVIQTKHLAQIRFELGEEQGEIWSRNLQQALTRLDRNLGGGEGNNSV